VSDDTVWEYCAVYRDDAGDIHWDWGYRQPPEPDADGEISTGKRAWGKLFEIKRRPVALEESFWMSSDCPWRAAAAEAPEIFPGIGAALDRLTIRPTNEDTTT